MATTCRRLHDEVRDAPHLFEPSARAQSPSSVLAGVMRRAAAEAPELLILLRQRAGTWGSQLERERDAAKVDWRRSCLEYEEQVLSEYAKRCAYRQGWGLRLR